MAAALAVTAGHYSDRGRKAANQDFHGMVVPGPPLLATKGIALAIADGISSSPVSHIASQSAVKAFLTDYYCTSEAWSVKTSAHRVLAATNSWLHAQTRRARDEPERGLVCTLSAMVLRSATAHLFHVGDSRIWRVSGAGLEQLTEDHRLVTAGQSLLGRAMGVNREIDIDYRAVPVAVGDVFVLTTDGVHDHVPPRAIAEVIGRHGDDFDLAARGIAEMALAQGSDDNLTVQLLRIDALPTGEAAEAISLGEELPLPPLLAPRMEFDGYRVQRELHASSRSHVYLAEELEGGGLVVLKIPSIDLRADAAYLRRFMMEDWVARRIDNAHVLRPARTGRRRNFLYVVTEFVEGQTLAQWMADHPRPSLERVRGIVEQVARGLGAFHRREMLHQDLRPENIIIDAHGTARIIDFGSVHVAGVAEGAATDGVLGTHQYAAPEYFLGEEGTPRSDLFSLGVIAYQMLTGRLPYGATVARAGSRAAQRGLRYRSAVSLRADVPAWADRALEKAVRIDPSRRYGEVSEFLQDLRQPNPELARAAPALIERNPVLVWQGVSLVLAVLVLVLLHRLMAGP